MHVHISAFLRFWGFVFFISTTLVAILKRELEDEEETEGVVDTYKLLGKIVKLPAVISLIVILLTSKVSTIQQLLFLVHSPSDRPIM